MTKTEQITISIKKYLEFEKQNGKHYVDLTAREVGKMLGISNRYPMCVKAMETVAKLYKHEILHDVRSHQSTTVEYRYYL